MRFSFHNTFRKNAWVFSPSELLTSVLILLFFFLSLGAIFAERPGSEAAFWQATLSAVLWLFWMGYVAVRRPPPFGGWGLIRGLSPWLGLVLCYSLMKPLVPVLHPQLFDADLHQLDLRLLGRGPSFFQQALMGRPHLTDLFSVCYLGLFAWLLGLLIFHSYLRRALYQRFMLGLILVYIGGFMGYLIYPAVGPRFAYPQEWTWLQGGIIFKAAEFLIVSLGARFDVFPSLHGAISAYLLFWQMAHDRRSLVWGLPLTIGIWLSTLFLGFHYLPDLISGGLLAAVSAWAAPQVEILVGAYRRTLHPPRVWLLNLTEGHGDSYGKLAGRLSELIPLGGQTSPGFITGNLPRARGEEAVRQALGDLGEGPFWLRPSDSSGSKKSALQALKPLSTEQVIRAVFNPAVKRHFIVQKALKVSAVGLCRSFPPRGFKLTDVEIRVTSLPAGDVLILRLTPQRNLFKGFLETPWNYFPASFPLRGFELFDMVKLTRKLAQRWQQFTEVEWILSGGKVYVLDGRPVRGENPAPGSRD
ncbi:MAG TPA: phosphatase PAP2 family protein [bacterium]|nr:phosphatase PAP2 family protein [bacterium]